MISQYIAGVFEVPPPVATSHRSIENPNLPLTDPAVWESVFGDVFGSAAGINVTAEKALMYAPVWHAVQLISGDVARLPLCVYKRRPDISDDARERDRGHFLNYLLGTAANDETESIKFWGRFMSHALLWGNGYAYISRDGTGRAAELFNLLPDRTHPEIVDGRLVYVTEISGARGPKLQAIMPWDVLHIEGLATANYVAHQVFRMARNSIALGLAQENFASKFFKNGGRIGGILELPAAMSGPARTNVEDGFRKTYEGTDNPFKTVILRDNAKFHSGQVSPQDSQMVEASEAQTRMIAHWFNLPPSKLGLSDSVSYNSKSEDNQNYLDTTLSIWLARIASACNFRLLTTRSEGTHFVEHNTGALLRMDLLKQAQAYNTLIAARVMNPNEARAKLNMMPYEGGDEFVNPNTMKQGAPDAEKPAEDEPEEDDEQPAKKSSEYMRMLFEITARAREKAKRPNAFIDWLDGNLSPHRSAYAGSEPFPFDEILGRFQRIAEKAHAGKLPGEVETICKEIEDGTQTD